MPDTPDVLSTLSALLARFDDAERARDAAAREQAEWRARLEAKVDATLVEARTTNGRVTRLEGRMDAEDRVASALQAERERVAQADDRGTKGAMRRVAETVGGSLATALITAAVVYASTH